MARHSGQDQPIDCAFCAQTLGQCGMFGVDCDNLPRLGGLGDQRTANSQRLLVGQGEDSPSSQSRQRCHSPVDPVIPLSTASHGIAATQLPHPAQRRCGGGLYLSTAQPRRLASAYSASWRSWTVVARLTATICAALSNTCRANSAISSLQRPSPPPGTDWDDPRRPPRPVFRSSRCCPRSPRHARGKCDSWTCHIHAPRFALWQLGGGIGGVGELWISDPEVRRCSLVPGRPHQPRTRSARTVFHRLGPGSSIWNQAWPR